MKAIALGLALLAGAAHAEIVGQVAGVHDGDTLTICPATGPALTVRLVEIDAPELAQPFGAESRAALAALCEGREARIAEQGLDKYGRTLGRVSCAGIDANAEQVKRGWAWFYTKYGTDAAIRFLEVQARAARIGLWRDAQPVAPWDFRHGTASPVAANCGPKRTCREMVDCAEARRYLACGLTRLDRDRDGVPCEALCRGR